VDGFGVDPGTLGAVAGNLQRASGLLDEGAAPTYDVPDAGISTPVVTQAMYLVGTAAMALASGIDVMVDKIDFTDASYDDVENDNAGALRLQQNPSDPSTDSGPLKDAGDRPHNLPAQRPR
jgi:hypothetical protein